MKKYILPLAMLFAISSHLYAATVSLADAQNVAVNFFKVTAPNAGTPTATLAYTKAEATGSVDFYVFNISPAKGFVIVAANDNITPILAYSTESGFGADFHKTGVNHWVLKTSSAIRLAVQDNMVADARIQGQWSAYRQGIDPIAQRSGSVAPLCTTTWDQENDVSNPPPYLYNQFCPYYTQDNERALTGCVATAMAQIMKFWNYPAVGTGSFSYDDNMSNGYSYNYGVQTSDFAAHTYQWDSMPVVLTDNTTAAQDSAVGVLMYDCAVSVGMDFGDDNQDGSGANGLLAEELPYGDSLCSQTGLVWYFGYDIDSIRGVFDSSYTASAWTSMIEHEMDMGRPVLYEGDDTVGNQGGHAWVCDGYDATDMLHMNWGWSGLYNGYFAINNLATSNGPGAQPPNFNPIDYDDALIGIMPKKHTSANGITAVAEAPVFSVFPNPAANQLMLQTNMTGSGATWNIN
jgi:hypothetical protein